MKNNSRRTFLRQTAAATAVLCAKGSLSWAQLSGTTGKISGWLTGDNVRFKEIDVQPWLSSGASMGSVSVEIDPARSFQSILGFGGAFTDASCYLISRMPVDQRQQFMKEFFGKDGLGFSVGRTCIGSSDYSRSAYSFDDSPTPDPELKNFSIAHDRDYILPTLRYAQQVNPEMFLFSSPWSPPGWMKAGGSLLGGSMRKHYFDSYAQYFVKFLQRYKAEGVNIQAITVQNETDTDQDSRMPACLWGQEYEIGFVRDSLGPAFSKASIETKIWILDHNYNLWGRVIDQLGDADFAKYVDGIAWHGYVGTPDSMTKVHDAYPSKGMYWTEGGPDYTAPDYQTDWATWSATYAGILKNWARCIVGWNLVLDESGKPNIGPFSCGGMVTLDSRTGKVSHSGQYWAFAHYSKAIQRGAKVIGTKASAKDLEHVAVANPDGSYVVVLTNTGSERDVECRFGGRSTRVKMPHNSVATLRWS